MIDQIFATRLANFRLVIENSKGPLFLSKKLGYKNPSFLSHLAGPKPTRHITERTARLIEDRLGLTRGWLDRTHPQNDTLASPNTTESLPERLLTNPNAVQTGTTAMAPNDAIVVNTAQLTLCLEKVLARASGMTPKQVAAMTAVLYDSQKPSAQLDSLIDSLFELMPINTTN